MFRRRAFTHHCVSDSRLAPVGGRKLEKRLNRCDLSAKGRLPHVYFLTKIPLIYYENTIFEIIVTKPEKQ
jgi:hypothetical protein